MISHREQAALAEGRRLAVANGHAMGTPVEQSSIVYIPCGHCRAEVRLLKGSTEISGEALSAACPAASSPEVRCA